MNRSFKLWLAMWAGITLVGATAGCGGGSIPANDTTNPGGDTTTPDDGQDPADGNGGGGGNTDGTPDDGGDTGDSTDTGGGDDGDGNTMLPPVEVDETEVLDLLTAGLLDDAAILSNDTPTAEAPFFGEDPGLYAGIDLTLAGDIDLGGLLDSADRGSSARSAAQSSGPAAHGFLGGHHDGDGILRGQWFASDESAMGAVRGEWTELDTGLGMEGNLRVGRFHAKYVDDQGDFQGFLRGRWAHAEGGLGYFLGRWYDDDEQLLGVMRGHWDGAAVGGDAPGVFVGRWAAFDICAESTDVPSAVQDTVDLDALADVLASLGVDTPNLPGGQTEDLDDIADVKIRGQAPCVDVDDPHGFLRGTHTPGTDDAPGTFEGRWIDPQGNVIGTVHGVHGAKAVILSTLPTEETITIEPDNFPDGTDLTSVSPHVTLSTTVTDGGIVALFEITASDDGMGNAPTGSKVFGHSNIPFFNVHRRLRMDFVGGASMVEVLFGGGTFSQPEIGRLEVFDANNNLLEEYVSSPKLAGESEVMNITRPTADIVWAQAYLADGDGSFGRLDKLTFTRSTVEGPGNPNAPPILLAEVRNGAGLLIGYIRGHFGVSDHDIGIFRGFYFNADFETQGAINGRWHVEEDQDAGSFEGVWSGPDLD